MFLEIVGGIDVRQLLDVPRVVGLKQTTRAVMAGQVQLVLLADDADDTLKRKVIELCAAHNVTCETVPSMKELGQECGIQVGAATVALLHA